VPLARDLTRRNRTSTLGNVGSCARRASIAKRVARCWLGLGRAVPLLSVLWVHEARADDSDSSTQSVLPIEVHGFVSQGFIKTTANNYLANSKDGSFEFSEVGINFSKDLTDRMRVGIQLFTHDLGPLGNYRTRFDWFYLDYHFFDWLGVRAGRTKLPFGLYNESSDIDAARVPVLLPQSVYPVSNRDYLLAQTGGEVYGDIPLGGVGSLEYRLYGGTVFFDTADVSSTLTNITVPYIFGGRLMWQTPIDGLQVGASLQKLRIDADYAIPADQVGPLEMAGSLPLGFSGPVALKIPALLGVASLEYSAHDWLLASEYSRWRIGLESPLKAFSAPTSVSERFYVMSAYHVTPWFTPGLYYSALFSNADDRSGSQPAFGSPPGSPPLGRGAFQHDLALTLRCDLNQYWLLKVEGHFMHGTAGLTSSLNDNLPLSSLTKDWGVLLVKTTAYF
jgi:hypothetical protein